MISNFLIFLCVAYSAYANVCNNPQVLHKTYSTNEALLSSKTVFITDMEVKCDGVDSNINLYAELNGHMTLVGRDTETGRYQVTFENQHKNFPANDYLINIFDEESYGIIRKNQRNSEFNGDVKPLFSINLKHRGVGYGPVVSTETIAILLASIVSLLVFSKRNKILA